MNDWCDLCHQHARYWSGMWGRSMQTCGCGDIPMRPWWSPPLVTAEEVAEFAVQEKRGPKPSGYYDRPKEDRTCVVCGTTFAAYVNGPRVTCSTSCFHRKRAGRYTPAAPRPRGLCALCKAPWREPTPGCKWCQTREGQRERRRRRGMSRRAAA